MAITSIKRKNKSGEMLAGNTKVDYSSTWLIERITYVGDTTISATFSNIPQEYKSLQIRAMVYPSPSLGLSGNPDLQFRFNGDATTNYAYNSSYGSDVYSNSNSDALSARASLRNILGGDGTGSTSNMSILVADIQDYSSTTKAKTTRYYGGYQRDSGGASVIAFGSNIWDSTSAITSIEFRPTSAYELGSGSTIALYGVR